RPAEVEALAAYVAGGGDALVLCDPGTPPGVAWRLRRFGVEPAGDLVVDEPARLFGTDGLSARVAYLNQGLVPDAPEVQALLPEAQSLRVVDAPGMRADYLATTAEGAWADIDRRAGEGATFRPGRDRRGPLPIATFTRVPVAGGREGGVVVIGDADFATNLHLGVLGNRDLLLTTAELVARAAPRGSDRHGRPRRAGGGRAPAHRGARRARLDRRDRTAVVAGSGVGSPRRARRAPSAGDRRSRSRRARRPRPRPGRAAPRAGRRRWPPPPRARAR